MIINTTSVKIDIDDVIVHFQTELKGIRTGKVNSEVLGGLFIEAYGASSQLNTMAQILVEDAVNVKITPWDRSIISNVDKSLRESNMGASVSIDKDSVRLRFNPITQEDRQKKIKELQAIEEDFKIRVRQVRQKYIKALDGAKGVSEDEVEREKKDLQKLIDDSIKNIEILTKTKSEELLKV
jgi:ribosome recycling factor